MSKYKSTKKFGRYLGVPLHGKKFKCGDYKYIMEQVVAKSNCWKKNSLALAGRITLAKSVIEAIPLFQMMTSKLPKSCIEEIYGLQRRFVWG